MGFGSGWKPLLIFGADDAPSCAAAKVSFSLSSLVFSDGLGFNLQLMLLCFTTLAFFIIRMLEAL